MKDLGFIIDKLYEIGWRPTDSSCCLPSEDGRLVPDERVMLNSFLNSSVRLQFNENTHSCCMIRWVTNGGAPISIFARSRYEGVLFAYVSCYRELKGSESSNNDQSQATRAGFMDSFELKNRQIGQSSKTHA